VTYQAEDEIAAIGSAIGAAFAGSLALTSTSGPGMALKSEFLSLAIMVELPLVVVNIQRAGPSTGMPTKTEQSDLLQALFGRFGESPCIVLAASTPADCFDMAYEACRLAVQHMSPVILLSDGFIANGAEPWKLPRVDELPAIPVEYRRDPDGFLPYGRDPQTLARPWALPGTPGLEHRVGGLEKTDGTGNVSYDPENHQHMVELRAGKIALVAEDIPPAEVLGEAKGDLLVVGWGSTFGAITSAVRRAQGEGRKVSHLHLRYLNPLPRNLGEVLAAFDKLLLPEINMGQLALLLQGRYLREVIPLNKVQGTPFKATEIYDRIVEILEAS
jgi:2-oxoglutarate ferredoxin oxidoreductase subunit alpha